MQRPPDKLVARAQEQARAAGRAVYLFRTEQGWQLTQRLAEIPGGAASLEIPPEPENPEIGNTGGC